MPQISRGFSRCGGVFVKLTHIPESLQIANSALIAYTPCGVAEPPGCFGLVAANTHEG